MTEDSLHLRCASCDVQLFGAPLLAGGELFCCAGCARGGPCTCTYEDQQEGRDSFTSSHPGFLRELFRIYGGTAE